MNFSILPHRSILESREEDRQNNISNIPPLRPIAFQHLKMNKVFVLFFIRDPVSRYRPGITKDEHPVTRSNLFTFPLSVYYVSFSQGSTRCARPETTDDDLRGYLMQIESNAPVEEEKRYLPNIIVIHDAEERELGSLIRGKYSQNDNFGSKSWPNFYKVTSR